MQAFYLCLFSFFIFMGSSDAHNSSPLLLKVNDVCGSVPCAGKPTVM